MEPMGAGHGHGTADTRVGRMVAASAILGVFFVLELTTALAIGSLALLADASHMLTDLVAMFTDASFSSRTFRCCFRGDAAVEVSNNHR